MNLIIQQDLKLELIDDHHAGALFAMLNNDKLYLREWMPWVDSQQSVDDTIRFVQHARKRHEAQNGFELAIMSNDSLVGILGVHTIDHINRKCSLGYWLGEGYQGQGFMTKSCQALIDYCYDTLDLNRIEIRCATHNYKSQGIPKRLHFIHEGTMRQAEYLNGAFVDHHLYAKLKSDR
ncbi:MAG: GNAT family N-acetyltransferase [Candidatus Kapabacteria bacterium]|nr:GNAT family N-acetyltransferase [Candidatus Kapabacteria bacterium]